MNYGQVKSQFVGLMNNKLLTANTALQDTFLQNAIVRTQRKLRVPAMEKVVETTIGVDYDGLAIPGDYIELIGLENEDGTPIKLRKLSEVKRAARNTGCPRVFARQGGTWFFGPAPVAGAIIRANYYAEFPPVSADGDSNMLTIIGGDVIQYGALSAAGKYYTDNRANGFEAQYMALRDELQDQGDREALTGDASVAPAMHFDDSLMP